MSLVLPLLDPSLSIDLILGCNILLGIWALRVTLRLVVKQSRCDPQSTLGLVVRVSHVRAHSHSHVESL